MGGARAPKAPPLPTPLQALAKLLGTYIVLDTAETKMQILTHSMKAGSMSRLIQPGLAQECIVTN